MCHVILLLPLLGLAVFWVWPLSIALPVYAVVAALSAWSYWYVLKAVQRPVMTGMEEMGGALGRVLEVGDHDARVRVHSEVWSAESDDALRPGDWVEVTKVSGLRLTVRRLERQLLEADGQPLQADHRGGDHHEHTFIPHA